MAEVVAAVEYLHSLGVVHRVRLARTRLYVTCILCIKQHMHTHIPPPPHTHTYTHTHTRTITQKPRAHMHPLTAVSLCIHTLLTVYTMATRGIIGNVPKRGFPVMEL